jgi:hypothetical protein
VKSTIPARDFNSRLALIIRLRYNVAVAKNDARLLATGSLRPEEPRSAIAESKTTLHLHPEAS